MKNLFIATIAALGLSVWPAAYAHADDWEDVYDEMEEAEEERLEALEDMAEDGYFVSPHHDRYHPAAHRHVDRVERVYIERERPRDYERTIIIEE